LIAAAAKLFRAKGFAATTTRDIAQAVGMRSGSPFYHFEHKEALLEAVMQSGMERALASQKALLQALRDSLLKSEQEAMKTRWEPADFSSKIPPEAAHQTLAALIRHHFEVLLGPASDFIPVMLYEWRALPADAQARIKRLQTDYEADWLPVLAALHAAGRLRGDVKLARLLMLGALNWSVQWYRVERSAGGGVDLDGLAGNVMEMMVRSADGS
jgi:AcrR family transcriptional regulator